MVNFNQPEPEFENPVDINQKDEPVVISNVKQQEMDEIAARVRAINAGKVFENTPKPMPDKTVFEMPPTPPRVDEKQWYKEPPHQEINREPPLVERRKQFTLNANKHTPAEVDAIIRRCNFHTPGGDRKISLKNVHFPKEWLDMQGFTYIANGQAEVAKVVEKPKKKGWFK